MKNRVKFRRIVKCFFGFHKFTDVQYNKNGKVRKSRECIFCGKQEKSMFVNSLDILKR